MNKRKSPNAVNIAAPHKTQGKEPHSGNQQGAGRSEGAKLWLYGLHTVTAALQNPARQKLRLLTTQNAAENLAARLGEINPPPEITDSPAIAKQLPPGAVHQGIALQVRPLPDRALEVVCAKQENAQQRLVVVLDQLTDPHNVGAILRSAAAFGASAVVLTGRNAPPPTGVLAKAASGALDVVPLIYVTNLARALEQLAALGFWRVGLASEATQPIGEIDLTGDIAVVLGAEGSGMRHLTASKCDFIARLPTNQTLASLNVSNAAAIILYEIVRRHSASQEI